MHTAWRLELSGGPPRAPGWGLATDMNEIYSNAISRIPESVANFQKQGSNLRVMTVVK